MIEIHNNSVPIVVLQFWPWLHHGGLGVARTVGRLGVQVYWVHGQTRAPLAASSRYVHERLFCDANAPIEVSVECLLEWGRRIGRKSVLIPIDDVAAIFVADQAETLKEWFLVPEQPAGLARSLSSKKDMHSLCTEMNVPTPKVTFPQSVEDVATFVETADFPIVMKRVAGWHLEQTRERASVTVVNSPEELIGEYKRTERSGDQNLMLQEYIPGTPDTFWVFQGYFASNTECLVGFTGRKIRQKPPFGGTTTFGICLKNETLEGMAIDFMQRVGYRGVVDMEYRYDYRDGQYKLLDVNPRVGAQFRLFVDSVGMDIVRALYLDLTGQPVRRGALREGRKWVVEQDDLTTALRYGRLGSLTLTEWISSLRGVEEGAWFARDDPVPFAAMCFEFFGRLPRKLIGWATADRAT